MKVSALLKVKNRRNPDDDVPYFKFGLAINWEHLSKAKDDLALIEAAKAIAFLGQWGSLKSPVHLQSFLTWLKQLAKEAVTMEELAIETTPLADGLTEKIATMFQSGLDVKGIGSTNASKILHLRLPKLVVMWDGGIEQYYRNQLSNLRPTPEFFATGFLRCMRAEIDEAIQDYSDTKRVSQNEAVECLRAEFAPKSVAKALDEFNWLRKRGEV